MHRLFFALWPDDVTRQKLAAHRDALARDCRGRATRPDTLHLTLLFVGSVEDLRLPTLMACGDGILSHGFSLSIDRQGGFTKARVCWLSCNRSPTGLIVLQQVLQARVAAAGFDAPVAPFHPHVTMARKCEIPICDGDVAAIEWCVDSFALVDSVGGPAGASYRLLKRWPLGA